MENAKHTPTPYKATHIGEGEFRREIIVDVANCGQIAEVLDTGNGKANAEFIALACNAHRELAEALNNLLVMLDEGIGDAAHEDRRFAHECITDARAALLKAGIDTSSTPART